MEEYIEIQEKKYKYVSRYRNNEELRQSFNELAKKTFGIDFEQWYKDGYWSDRYMPYSLLDKEKVVANVSISIVDILIDGNKKKYMQIGTVMVDEDYRGIGLSKVLMEKVLSEWE
ncbi:MAG: GNAT family N-acetyltransferase, partial [Peptostreptococcaceae bacterium]